MDLSLVPWEQMQEEMNRRFPAYVIAFLHPVDGQQGLLTRMAAGGTMMSPPTHIGLADMLYKTMVGNVLKQNKDLGPGNNSLDIIA